MKNIQIVLLSALMLLMQCGSMFAAEKKFPHPSLERNKLALKVSSLLSDKAHAEMALSPIEDKIPTLLIFQLSSIFSVGLEAMNFYKTTPQQRNERPMLAMLSTGALVGCFLLHAYVLMLKHKNKIADCDAKIADYYAQATEADKKIEQLNNELKHKKK